jgi:hypothetical protein
MPLLGGLFGSLFGGGGSSSSVSSTVNIDVQGLNDIGVTETITLNPVSVTLGETITLEPVTVTFDENLTVQPVTLNENIDIQPLTFNENVALQPVTVTLDENIDLQPVTLNENIDLKPVAVDTCQTLRLAPLPDTRVSNPYHHRVTYHMFGMEMVSVCYDGESGQNIESPHHPQVFEGPIRIEGRRDDRPEIVGDGPGIRVRVIDPDHE